MDQEPMRPAPDSESKTPSYRDKCDYIYPFPSFVTRATFDKPSYPRPPRADPPSAEMGDKIADFSI